MDPIDITEASVKQVLNLVLRTGLFLKGCSGNRGAHGASGGFSSWGDQRLFQHVNSGGLKTCKFVKIWRSVFYDQNNFVLILICRAEI